nr:uncharacterized protein LOC110800018 [Spinacia oleracea]
MLADQATNPSLNPNSAFFFSNNDVNASKLVSIVFDGKCFNNWKRSMLIALSARNKLCFVDGSLNQPATNSPNHIILTKCNDLVISWMLASLEPSIARSVMYLKTTREICLDLEDSCTLTQKLLKSQQNQRLIQFLMKLNPKYEHPKSTILMMNLLPTISKAYGLLLQDDQQREVQNNRGHMNSESIVFTARKFVDNKYKSQYNSSPSNQNTFYGGKSRNNTRNNLFCEHCRMKNHIVYKCWKLHVYPKDFKGKGKRVAAAVQVEETYANDNSTQEETCMSCSCYIHRGAV